MERDSLIQGFAAGVDALPPDAVDHLGSAAYDYGYRAARFAIAPAVWAKAVGDRFDTAALMAWLGVSRQALHKRTAAGSLIEIPGRRTTYYPKWQFDLEARDVRPVVRQLTAAFMEELGEANPIVIAAWATTPQEDLHGLSAAEAIDKGLDESELIRAAHRAAGRLAE